MALLNKITETLRSTLTMGVRSAKQREHEIATRLLPPLREEEQRLQLVSIRDIHPDDIMEIVMRGCESAGRRARYRLGFDHWAHDHSDALEAPESKPTVEWWMGLEDVSLLSLGDAFPGSQSPMPIRRSGVLSVDMLTFLLEPVLRERLPALLNEFFPAASGNMKLSERKAKLDKLRAKITALEAEYDELRAALGEAHRDTGKPASEVAHV